MAYLGIPLLLLGAVGVYAFIVQKRNNPTPVTDGGVANATTSSNPANRGGPLEVVAAGGGGAITNPTIDSGVLLPKPPGQVRGDVEKGQHPYNSLQDKRPRSRPSTGVDFYPADGRVTSGGQAPAISALSEASSLPLASTTRSSPDTSAIGLPNLPKPLSTLVNAAKSGGGNPFLDRGLFFHAVSQQPAVLVDTVGSVPRNYGTISSSALHDPPQAGDIWDSKRARLTSKNITRRNPPGPSDRVPIAGITNQLHLNGIVGRP